MRKVIGWALLLGVIIGFFAVEVWLFGWADTLKSYGLGLLLGGIVFFACWLIKEDA